MFSPEVRFKGEVRWQTNKSLKKSVMSHKTFSQLYSDQQISLRQQLQFKKLVVGGAREEWRHWGAAAKF